MNAVDQVGRPTPEHVAYAASLLAQLPDRLRHAAREPIGSRAVVLGLLLPRDAEPRRAMIEGALSSLEPAVRNLLLQLVQDIDALSPLARLPLIDLALPALRRLSPEQYRDLRSQMDALIEADHHVELFEWMLQRLVVRHLNPRFGHRTRHKTRHHTVRAVLGPIACLLSAVAHVGHRDAANATVAYNAGLGALGATRTMLAPSSCGLSAVSAALDELASAAPQVKKRVLEACAACIAADRQVQPREAELLRAVADALDCPMPPLLPGQPLA